MEYTTDFWTRMELGLTKIGPPYSVIFKRGWAYILKGGREIAQCNGAYFHARFTEAIKGNMSEQNKKRHQRKGA